MSYYDPITDSVIDDDFVQEFEDNYPSCIRASQEISPYIPPRTLQTLVQETFSENFERNGKEALDILAKVDPATYIKQVVALIPKQANINANMQASGQIVIKQINSEVSKVIDELTGYTDFEEL